MINGHFSHPPASLVQTGRTGSILIIMIIITSHYHCHQSLSLSLVIIIITSHYHYHQSLSLSLVIIIVTSHDHHHQSLSLSLVIIVTRRGGLSPARGAAAAAGAGGGPGAARGGGDRHPRRVRGAHPRPPPHPRTHTRQVSAWPALITIICNAMVWFNTMVALWSEVETAIK